MAKKTTKAILVAMAIDVFAVAMIAMILKIPHTTGHLAVVAISNIAVVLTTSFIITKKAVH